MNTKKRDLINLADLSVKEIEKLLELSIKLKHRRYRISSELKGKTIALIFQKPSNRTRVSFEVGIHQLGGNCIYLGPEEINLGKRESAHDVAHTLSRYIDGIVARVFAHQDVVELARHAKVPVINGLCDLYHPCQAMADVLSIKEKFNNLKGVKLAYIGDGNNVCHSLMLAGAQLGLQMRIATPKNYEVLRAVAGIAQEIGKKNGASFEFGHDPVKAVAGAQVIYSDTWVSMGQEEESKRRLKDFQGFQVNDELVNKADKNFIFMHCLPAHRGEEVSADVIDGPHSIVFDQAENRLHVQKALMIFLMGKK